MGNRDNSGEASGIVRRRIEEAAARALAEAAARRKLVSERPEPPREIDGRGGAEPIRYGDWEVKGLASDF